MLPEVRTAAEWLQPANIAAAAEHLLEHMQFDQPREALESDVIRALQDSDHIDFEWSSQVDTTCELHGTYSSPPAHIRVSRQQPTARANFTAAHEFGHHLQRHDDEWAMDVMAVLRHSDPVMMRHVEEAVSNRVAVNLLMPERIVEDAWTGQLTPAFIRALTRNGHVSRQAATIRASAWSQESEPHAVIIVADPLTGLVLSSESHETSSLTRPPKNSVQPDFRALTAGPEGTRGATEGFIYSTNSARSDITYDWGWDASGTHLLIVARPTYRFGTAQWDRDDIECQSASCDSSFSRNDAVLCPTCMHHVCPDCGACACERRRGTTCADCGMEMSIRESQIGTTHEECPF